jgi:hypothetical protein
MKDITLICPTEPYSSLSLDLIKLKISLSRSHRRNRKAYRPFKKDVIRNTRGIECHEERPDRFNFLEAQKKNKHTTQLSNPFIQLKKLD